MPAEGERRKLTRRAVPVKTGRPHATNRRDLEAAPCIWRARAGTTMIRGAVLSVDRPSTDRTAGAVAYSAPPVRGEGGHMGKIEWTRWRFAMWVMVLSGACASEDRSASGRGVATLRDSGGVTIVENRAAAPADVASWSVDTVDALSIGAAGDTAYEFNRIGSIQQLPNGMI